MYQFKSLARSQLWKLQVDTALDFIFNTLLNDWTAVQLKSYNINYPVSHHIVTRLIYESGFNCEAHWKSYSADPHEVPDVVDYYKYVKFCLETEPCEQCWAQLPLHEYESRMKLKRSSEASLRQSKNKLQKKKYGKASARRGENRGKTFFGIW